MERASKEERYEDAAQIRDRIEILKSTWAERPSVSFGSSSQDAIGLYREEAQAEISILRVRDGRLLESKTFGFSEVYSEDEELIESFMSQYYQKSSEFPEEILLSNPVSDRELREELYSSFRGKKVVLNLPKKGSKARLVRLAETNAKENFSSRSVKNNVQIKALEELRDKLSLEELPRTIECIDISHFQGGSTVGSVVHFKDGRPDKSRYRRFHLEHQDKPDDFASMKEVIRRHLSRLVEENATPDLIVIDGGKGQLSSACARKRGPRFLWAQDGGACKEASS